MILKWDVLGIIESGNPNPIISAAQSQYTFVPSRGGKDAQIKTGLAFDQLQENNICIQPGEWLKQMQHGDNEGASVRSDRRPAGIGIRATAVDSPRRRRKAFDSREAGWVIQRDPSVVRSWHEFRDTIMKLPCD